jgi:hypothetical protein
MIALTVGTVLAIGALYYVLQPLFKASPRGSPGAWRLHPPPAPTERPGEREALDALREIEFDRETGKLADHDYAVLKERYTNEALAAMRAEDVADADGTGGTADVAGSVPVDEVEALISRFRRMGVLCPSCGPRPESNAAYCSNCGRYLSAACSRCGAQAPGPGAKFCPNCGASLAA